MSEDWVNVRLTAFGERYLKENGGGPANVHEGTGFSVESGKAVRVTRAFDWERVLKQQHVNGHALFEIAEEAAGNRQQATGKKKATVEGGGATRVSTGEEK